MAKTQGDRLWELEQTVAELRAAREGMAKALDVLSVDRKATDAELQHARRDLAVLQEKVVKLESSRDKAGNRAWSVVPNISGAVVSGVIAAAVAFLVARYGK